MLFTMNTRNLSDQAHLELHRINVAMCPAHGGRKPHKGHLQVLHAPFVPFGQSVWMVIDLSIRSGVIAVIRYRSTWVTKPQKMSKQCGIFHLKISIKKYTCTTFLGIVWLLPIGNSGEPLFIGECPIGSDP